MKKSITIACLLLSFISCNDGMEKPKNLIEKDKMVDILYDLTLLEAVKSQNVGGGINKKMANEYVFKKYKIDSIQLAESNKYYASDVEEYKKMFEKIKQKLDEESQKNGVNNQVTPMPDTPQIQ